MTDAVAATRRLVTDGLDVTLDHLGEDTTDVATAENTVRAYLPLLDALAAAGLTAHAEVSVKLSAVGQKLDEGLALAQRRRHLRQRPSGSARRSRWTWRTTPPPTPRWPCWPAARRLPADRCRAAGVPAAHRRRLPAPGRHRLPRAAVQGRLCRAGVRCLPGPGTTSTCSYVRCANVLLAGDGYPMFATHDPMLVQHHRERARWHDRKPGSLRIPDALRHPP